MRINKALALLGICSRRDADRLILAGRIQLNHKPATLALQVFPADILTFDGEDYVVPVQQNVKVWLYHKPAGLITTHKDPQGRMTVFDDLGGKLGARVISIGRLDLNSQGLLLLTNSGEFARFAENPKTGWKRVYLVRVFGYFTNRMRQEIQCGITVEGIRYAPMQIDILERKNSSNFWIRCSLSEGKNREIRRILQHFGLQVSKLIRIQYGPYTLGKLPSGSVKSVPVFYTPSDGGDF